MKLESSILTSIRNRPTLTILRDQSSEANSNFINVLKVSPVRRLKIPDSFDGRVAWKGMLTRPLNQGRCGSCWAFAASGVLADRFNIQSRGLIHVELSPTKLILCNWQGKEIEFSSLNKESQEFEIQATKQAFESSACFGNSLVDACRYLYQVGTPTLECIPYDQELGIQSEYQKIGFFDSVAKLPLCSSITGPIGDMCAGSYIDSRTGTEYGKPQRFYRALHFYGIAGVEQDGGSELYIRDNIYKWGPVATGMRIYADFYTFDPKTTVYRWDRTSPSVGEGHAIALVGWGVSSKDNQKYWIVRNSWGTEWGMDGYFYMARGTNECEIEANCMGMVPDFFYPSDHTYSARFNGKYENIEQSSIRTGRDQITSYINTKAGGIDPNTGYTRRVEIQMPWLDLSRPIDLSKLPDWKTFVAGEINVSNNNNKGLYSLQSGDSVNGTRILIFLSIICGISILGFILVHRYRKKSGKAYA